MQLTAPPTVIRELVAEQLHFLPAAPTTEDYTSFTHRKIASVRGSIYDIYVSASIHGRITHREQAQASSLWTDKRPGIRFLVDASEGLRGVGE